MYTLKGSMCSLSNESNMAKNAVMTLACRCTFPAQRDKEGSCVHASASRGGGHGAEKGFYSMSVGKVSW
jgi:hypothetical protein